MGNQPNKSDVNIAEDPITTTKKKRISHSSSRSRPSEKKQAPGILDNVDVSKLKHPLSDPIDKYYALTDKILGIGNFSVVRLGVSKETGERCAIKIISKENIKNKPQMLANEIDILLRVNHPNIIALRDIFDTPKETMLCMELVTGGELFDRIVEREHFSEREAKEIMKQLFDAINYLHKAGIVHRDLKPENLLLENEKDNIIKLADFGLSKIYTEEMLSTACGTPGYVAPEILNCERYSFEIDLWSSGVIMLCGYPPFYHEHEAALFEAIMEGRYEFHSPYWDHISAEAKDLISKLLVVDPKKRLTAEQALAHPWFKSKSGSKRMHQKFPQLLADHNTQRKASMVKAKDKTDKKYKDNDRDKEKDKDIDRLKEKQKYRETKDVIRVSKHKPKKRSKSAQPGL